MKKYILLFLFILSCILPSCSLLIKSVVNSKYPPINTMQKKLESIQKSNSNLDTGAAYAIETNLTQTFADTCSSLALKKSNSNFALNSDVVDSITIKNFRSQFGKQELKLKGTQTVYLSSKSNKWISSVDFYVSASSLPYYAADTVYLNPNFNRIHVKRIHFKKCSFLTKLKILTGLVNSVFDNYLPNINGQIKNYYVTSVPIKPGGISIGSTLSGQSDVKIIHDDTIKWTSHLFAPSFLINKQSISLLLREIQSLPEQKGNLIESAKSRHSMRKAFDSLYKLYTSKFQQTALRNFDTGIINSNSLVAFNLSNTFSQGLLNASLSQLDFQFAYPIGYQVSGINQDITLGKPNVNCGCDDIVNRWFNCRGGPLGIPCRIAKAAALGACYVGSFTLPVISSYMTFCVAMKALPNNFQWNIGSIKGDARAEFSVDGLLSKIQITDTFSKVDITKQLSVNGNISYDFNFSPFNKFNIGAAVFGILTQCGNLEMKGNPFVNGLIPNDFVLTLTKQQIDHESKLIISIDPFLATVNLSQSPGLALVSDFKNYFTCNIGYTVGGIIFAMAQVAPNQIIPDKFRDYFDVATKGKLDHTFKIKSLTIPLSFDTKTILGKSRTDMMWGLKSLNSISYFSQK